MDSPQWRTLAGLALALTLASCAPAGTDTIIPTIALDSASPFEDSIVQASAEVVPSQESHLSFVISGLIEELNVEEGTVVEAGQNLATLSSPDLEYRIVEAESAVRAAEFDYEYWKLPRIIGGRLTERGELAKQELEAARRSLETAQAELTQTILVAPYSATVVSIEVQPGEFVRPGQVIIVLAKLNELKVETIDLSELSVAVVDIGQPATVYVEALDKEYPGVVTGISPISDTIGGDVVFKVTVQLEEPRLDLLWGMSADVQIYTEQ
jgi:HlyD family secretion protein